MLRPRCAMSLDHPEPRFRQDCVVMDYVTAGRLPERVVLDSATWTIEVSDHALGRLIQRTGLAAPAALLFIAHHAALDLPMPDQVGDGRNDVAIVLPTGSAGHFRVVLRAGHYGNRGDDIALSVFCHTWMR